MINYEKAGHRSCNESINSVERKYQISLPSDYRKFLLIHSGAIPEPNYVGSLDGIDDKGIGVRRFYSTSELIDMYNLMANRIPEKTIPIADAECGNHILLSTGNQNSVYFWDHEYEAEEDQKADYQNMTLLAQSFNEFLEKLVPDNLDNIIIDPEKDKLIWVDKDFKPKFD